MKRATFRSTMEHDGVRGIELITLDEASDVTVHFWRDGHVTVTEHAAQGIDFYRDSPLWEEIACDEL